MQSPSDSLRAGLKALYAALTVVALEPLKLPTAALPKALLSPAEFCILKSLGYIAAIACISLSFALLALSSFAGVDAGLVKILGFYQLNKGADLPLIRQLSCILFTLLALLPWLTLRYGAAKKPLALLLVLCAFPPLWTLTGSIHWIEPLGGFPAIGSGQGIIKYAALLALA